MLWAIQVSKLAIMKGRLQHRSLFNTTKLCDHPQADQSSIRAPETTHIDRHCAWEKQPAKANLLSWAIRPQTQSHVKIHISHTVFHHLLFINC